MSEHRDERGRLQYDPDAEPYDSATDDPMGRVRLPPPPKKKKADGQRKLKLTSHERASHVGWSVIKAKKPRKCRDCDEDMSCLECGMCSDCCPDDCWGGVL